jgi:hypothetical protein
VGAPEHEPDQVAKLVAAGIGIELVCELQRVVHGSGLPAGVRWHVAQHERQVEPDVVGHHRRVPDPGGELGEHLGCSGGVGHVLVADAVDLVPDDRATRVDQRLEAVDHLSALHAERGQVDDVAVLRLDGGRLDIDDDELRLPVSERLAQLDDGIGLGAEERRLLGLSGRGRQLLLEVDALLELAVGVFDGVGHDRLGQDLGSRLDHHHGLARAGDNQVERAVGELRHRRVGDEGAVDVADANRADRSQEGDAADHQRRRGAVDGEDVGVVLLVRREDRQHDLDVLLVAPREEWADRAVGQAHRQDGGLRRTRLALDEAAGDLARGVHALLVVNREGKEVDPLARLGRDRRRQEHGVAHADEHRSIGLLGELARLEREGLSADLGLYLDSH